ncbi:MAG: hypothetical protein U0821_15425 [Chloroflexota bacterium]
MLTRVLAILFSLSLALFPMAATAAGLTVGQTPPTIQMRLGISAGEAIQSLPRGSDRQALTSALPELFDTARALGIRIDSVSVGRGFWTEDGQVQSENDLDLVVTGPRENILALGATLGQRWEQSAVLAWELKSSGDMLTATMPLPGGTSSLNDPVFASLATVLTDGGHIKYAGAESLVFVAHTGEDTPDEFRLRMAAARTILEAAGLRVGNISFGEATMAAMDRDSYQRFIDGAIRGKAAQAITALRAA